MYGGSNVAVHRQGLEARDMLSTGCTAPHGSWWDKQIAYIYYLITLVSWQVTSRGLRQRMDNISRALLFASQKNPDETGGIYFQSNF